MKTQRLKTAKNNSCALPAAAWLAASALGLLLAACASPHPPPIVTAPPTPPPDIKAPVVPPDLLVPPGNKVSFRAYAVGVQIYDWKINPTNPAQSAWVLKAPTAALFDGAGQLVGSHYAGPTWEIKRGRRVEGTIEGVVLRRSMIDLNAVPWLLLQRTETGSGIFTNTTYIQRVKTTGGLAPTTAGEHAGQQARVPYTAEYFFYRPE